MYALFFIGRCKIIAKKASLKFVDLYTHEHTLKFAPYSRFISHNLCIKTQNNKDTTGY